MPPRHYRVSMASQLAAPPEALWAHATSMRGVNRELMPVLRMTYPGEAEGIGVNNVPPGVPLFTSTLLLLGVIPFDRHRLCLESVSPGVGFRESSTSLHQRVWIYERTITPTPEGCVLRDELTFVPRLAFLGPVLLPVIRRVFQKRHRTLRRIFGIPR